MFTCAELCHAITFLLSGMNTCRQDIETLTFKSHVRSDFGLFESFFNTGTFPEQIAITEKFSKFRKLMDCACLQTANFPRDIIE